MKPEDALYYQLPNRDYVGIPQPDFTSYKPYRGDDVVAYYYRTEKPKDA